MQHSAETQKHIRSLKAQRWYLEEQRKHYYGLGGWDPKSSDMRKVERLRKKILKIDRELMELGVDAAR